MPGSLPLLLFLTLFPTAISLLAASGSGQRRVSFAPAARETAPPPALSSLEPREEQIQREIAELGSEVERLSASERGVMDELNRLDALATLKELERSELDRNVAASQDRLEATERQLDDLAARSARTAARLRSRLRALYRQGPLRHYRILLAVADPGEALRSYRHVTAIASSDSSLVAEARDNRRQIDRTRVALLEEQRSLLAAREAVREASAALEGTREEKQKLLAAMRKDRQVRSGALEELRRARSALAVLTEELSRGETSRGIAGGSGFPGSSIAGLPLMDISRFRGLLPWPSPGKVSAPFGPALHPRFQTVVPHDGLDIEAPYGADIRAIFDGKVAYAGWLSGYGLTLLLDHGGGYLSVYTHASSLLAEAGEWVCQGQLVGKVGDSGSLRGPVLYFEIRRDGKALDPAVWLRGR